MKGNVNKIRSAVFVLLALFWSGLLFFPMPRTVASGADERYLCVWEDGSRTEERYFTAYRDFAGTTEEGTILIGRNGMHGEIAAGDAFLRAVRVFDGGNLGELFAADISGVTRLERVALYRRYRGRLWYADEFFAWSGADMVPAELAKAEEIVLLSGSLSAKKIAEAGVAALDLRAEAEFSADTLRGTHVGSVTAEAPYSSSGNAVCLSTPGGVRLLAGVPRAERVEVPREVYFADEGALLPCERIEEVSLPFAGSSVSDKGSAYKGEFAHLFSDGSAYLVPKTLKRVRISGGYLVSHAFYACGGIEEIDACGVSPDAIERDAFSDCLSLRLLHTPRADVRLAGNFRSHTAPCGCTVYERV